MTTEAMFEIFNHGAVPLKLLIALCTVESNLDVKAIHHHDGNGDSIGICQVKINTAKMFLPKIGMHKVGKRLAYSERLASKTLMRPSFNIIVASKYLRYQFNRYGSWRLAVSAYNSGTVKYMNDGRLNNTKYVNKVEKLWHKKTNQQ